ncbi:acyl-CoA dehydrogenase [Streptomyces sp. NPDC051561]|uniref:acyl-CoA dehydrogenase n=1 Tax=Streptomyces sp. NPDC051561 TaxID=3365658 RepID=UPI0037B82AE9
MDAAFTAEEDDAQRGAAEQDALRRTLHELLTDRTARTLARACEEAGRTLLSSPLLATSVLAAPLVRALGTDAQGTALLPGLTAGHTSATLAVPGGALSLALGLTGDNAGGHWSGGGRSGGVQARQAEKGWALYGQAEQVLDGHTADLLLVAAHTGGFARSRTLLFVVRAEGAAGLSRVRQPSADGARPQATLQLRDVEGELLGSGADVVEALVSVGRTAATLLAAEAVGAAERVLEGAIALPRGRDEGASWAEKQRLAEVYVQVTAARSAVCCAAADPAGGGALALAQGIEVLRAAAWEAVRLHGGTGDGREREAQLQFGRAACDELLFGPVHRLRDRAADAAGIFGPPAAGEPVSGASASGVPAPGAPASGAPAYHHDPHDKEAVR